MYRPAARAALRSASHTSFVAPVRRSIVGKRFASTTPVDGRRSWKSSAVRWGIAIAGIYYYNTSPVFAEQPQHNLLNPNVDAIDGEHDTSSIEALTSRRPRQTERNAGLLHSAADKVSSENASTTVVAEHEGLLSTGSAADLEEEADQQGAFNPETGEINWDCPCLGGMAHGPCGPEFREAFSCFVYSNEEPKGMDCIDKFQNMQQCFQKYPEVYKGELEDDEELDAGLEAERQELVNEIAERKAQEQERQAGSSRRLLEEPDPAPRPAKPKKAAASTTDAPPAKKYENEKSTSEHISSEKPPQQEGKVAADRPSAQPAGQEDTVESKKSPVTKEVNPPTPAKDSDTVEDSIIPRAAHDATSTPGLKSEK